MFIITTITKKLGDLLNQDSTITYREFEKGSTLLTATYYLNIMVSMAFFLISFFYFAVNPEMGFTFFFVFFCYFAVVFGIRSEDTISRILLILFDLAIGFAGLFFVISMPFVLMIYPILILTLYTLIFDSKAASLFHYKFNTKLWKLDVVLFLQYLCLIVIGFLDIQNFSSNLQIFLPYYTLLFLVFLVVWGVQKLSPNARKLMIFLTPFLAIYSFFDVQISQYAFVVVIINLLTLLVLLFDKTTIQEFKNVDNGSYYLFDTVLAVNIFAILGIAASLTSQYEYTFNNIYLIGFIFVIFYSFVLYKVLRYSKVWKEVLSVMLVILLLISLYFLTNITLDVLFIPTAIVSLYAFHFDYPTLQLFRGLKIQHED